MHPWVPVLVTVFLGLIGLGIQGAAMAFFLGKMRAEQTASAAASAANQAANRQLVDVFQAFTTKTVDAMLERLAEFDTMARDAAGARAALDQRLATVENAASGLAAVPLVLSEFKGEFNAHRQITERELAHVARNFDGVQRQLAELVRGGSGGVVPFDRQLASDARKGLPP